jgi:membrane protein
VAVRAGKDFVNHDMPTYAAALAFRALLALFPFAIFLLALLGSIGLTDFFDWLVGQAQTALPQDAASVVGRVTREIRNQATGGLLSFGIVTAIWVASTAVRSLLTASTPPTTWRSRGRSGSATRSRSPTPSAWPRC